MKDTDYPSEKRSELRVLVEDFLEKEIVELERLDNSAGAELFWKLNQILLKNTLLEGQPDAEDLAGTNFGKVLVEWHQLLSPVWRRFRKALFYYKENVLPERATHESMVKAVEEPSSPMHQYRALMGTVYFSEDKFYKLKLRGTAFSVSLSFDTGVVTMFRTEMNVINGFLDTLRNAPIDLFSRCRHCRKVIVITREGKAYCRGCASKAKQKELWEKDPEGCRERERKRYEQKRKVKKG